MLLLSLFLFLSQQHKEARAVIGQVLFKHSVVDELLFVVEHAGKEG